jgi:hypothetical protein
MLSMIKSENFIKNINIPSCRNCIYFKPHALNDYIELSKCQKFGDKDIISGKIDYDYADHCRKDDTKCGNEAKYFEKDENADIKYIYYAIIANVPIGVISVIIFLSVIIRIYDIVHTLL